MMTLLFRPRLAYDLAKGTREPERKTFPLWVLLWWLLPRSAANGGLLYRFIRWLEGAKKVEKADGGLKGTGGHIEVFASFSADVGGACPVRGWGEAVVMMKRYPFSYYSRGEGWDVVFFAPGTREEDADCGCAREIFTVKERLYYFPDGGWVSLNTSKECIQRAVEAFWLAIAMAMGFKLESEERE